MTTLARQFIVTTMTIRPDKERLITDRASRSAGLLAAPSAGLRTLSPSAAFQLHPSVFILPRRELTPSSVLYNTSRFDRVADAGSSFTRRWFAPFLPAWIERCLCA